MAFIRPPLIQCANLIQSVGNLVVEVNQRKRRSPLRGRSVSFIIIIIVIIIVIVLTAIISALYLVAFKSCKRKPANQRKLFAIFRMSSRFLLCAVCVGAGGWVKPQPSVEISRQLAKRLLADIFIGLIAAEWRKRDQKTSPSRRISPIGGFGFANGGFQHLPANWPPSLPVISPCSRPNFSHITFIKMGSKNFYFPSSVFFRISWFRIDWAMCQNEYFSDRTTLNCHLRSKWFHKILNF